MSQPTYSMTIDPDAPSVLVVRLRGELDAMTGAELVDAIERRCDGGVRYVILDCSEVVHVSSHTISVMIRIHHRLRRRGGDLLLAGPTQLVRTALEMTRLDKVFRSFDSLAAAREAAVAVEPASRR